MLSRDYKKENSIFWTPIPCPQSHHSSHSWLASTAPQEMRIGSFPFLPLVLDLIPTPQEQSSQGQELSLSIFNGKGASSPCPYHSIKRNRIILDLQVNLRVKGWFGIEQSNQFNLKVTVHINISSFRHSHPSESALKSS